MTRKIKRTYRPLPPRNTVKHAPQLALILHPLPAHQRHAHGPQAPAEKRHPLQLFLRKPPAAAKHVGAQRQLLDHVEIRPLDVVAEHDGRLILREQVAGHADPGAVVAREEVLDVNPYRGGYAGAEVVY